MKFSWSLIAAILSASVNAQDADSIKRKVPASWKKFEIAPRVGIGIQRTFYTEAGLSLQRYKYFKGYHAVVANIYSTFEWVPNSKKGGELTGLKLGYEFWNDGVVGGIEVKYLSGNGTEDVMITPKYGFGVGFVNIFYGFNFSTNKRPFPQVGKHQFSMAINTNLLFYHSKYEKKNKAVVVD